MSKKIDCPLCEGDGRDWDHDHSDGFNEADCPRCDGEGEVDDDE